MAHFAELDENNIVKQVIVISNQELLDENGDESESKGISFCKSLFGGEWVQTSYNGTFRKNYAGIGFSYDSELDAFIPPKPFSAWILNEECQWVPPIDKPDDGGSYFWDDSKNEWVAI